MVVIILLNTSCSTIKGQASPSFHTLEGVKCVVPENIHTPPTEGFLFCSRLPPGNSSLASHFASKIVAFKTPLPQGISDDLPWGGYGFFLEMHNANLDAIQLWHVASFTKFHNITTAI